jgi:hypothetical protein
MIEMDSISGRHARAPGRVADGSNRALPASSEHVVEKHHFCMHSIGEEETHIAAWNIGREDDRTKRARMADCVIYTDRLPYSTLE